MKHLFQSPEPHKTRTWCHMPAISEVEIEESEIQGCPLLQRVWGHPGLHECDSLSQKRNILNIILKLILWKKKNYRDWVWQWFLGCDTWTRGNGNKDNIKPQSHLCIRGHSWQGLQGHLEGCKTFQVIYLESGWCTEYEKNSRNPAKAAKGLKKKKNL